MRTALLPLAAMLVLAACAEPIDPDRQTDLPPIDETTAIEPELDPVEDPVEPVDAETEQDVPSIAEFQRVLDTCTPPQTVASVECEATSEGTEFTCKYSLAEDAPEIERETVIAAEGDTYTLIDIPENCQPQ